MQSKGLVNNLRKIAGLVAGLLVLLAAVFLATRLCSAASSPVSVAFSSLGSQNSTAAYKVELEAMTKMKPAAAGRSDLIPKPSR